MYRSVVLAEYCARKAATAGATCTSAKDIGAASRIVPVGELASSCAASSAATASARIRAARSERRTPVSVSDSRRDVRWNNVAPMLLSRRANAFDTVALERPRALDSGRASGRERVSQ